MARSVDPSYRRPSARWTLPCVVAVLCLVSLAGAESDGASESWVSTPHSEAFLTTSACSLDLGCPRSAMVWASGSFTALHLLTPAALLVEGNLTLKLSLCCGYKYHGAMLRDEELYGEFLDTLFYTTPFQVLSPSERAAIFPREKACIARTSGLLRAPPGGGDSVGIAWEVPAPRLFTSSYSPTEEDVARHDDGDGDVLILVTGKLSDQVLRKVSLPLSAGTFTHPRPSVGAPRSAGSSAAAELVAADMQLRISNRVLKCKCPHTLLVMPMLRLYPDVLPPISLLGTGRHCGVPRSSEHAAEAKVPRVGVRFVGPRSNGAPDAEGSYDATFAVDPPLPALTLVRWVITAEDAVRPGGTRSPVVVLDQTTLLRLPDSGDADGVGDDRYDYDLEDPLRTATNMATQTLHHRIAAASVDEVRDSVSYTVEVTAVRHDAQQRATGSFLMRLPLFRTWQVPAISPQPHFGVRRTVSVTRETLMRPSLIAALSSSAYYSYWELAAVSTGEDDANGAPWSTPLGEGQPQRDLRDVLEYRYKAGVAAQDEPNQTIGDLYAEREQEQQRERMIVQAMPSSEWPWATRRQNGSTVGSNVGAYPARGGRVQRLVVNPLAPPRYATGKGAPNALSVTLGVGGNLLSFYVRDVDDLCDPTLLEAHEVWSIQALLIAPPVTPSTACEEDVLLEALSMNRLVQRMRERVNLPLALTVHPTDVAAGAEGASESESDHDALALSVAEQHVVTWDAFEGKYSCADRLRGADPSVSSCDINVLDGLVDAPVLGRGRGTAATLRLRVKEAVGVHWSILVRVFNASFAREVNFDPAHAQLLSDEPASAQSPVVRITSRRAVITRRTSPIPRRVEVVLPMHEVTLQVEPPRTIDGKVAHGRWVVRPPLALVSVDPQALVATINARDVPNEERNLPDGTLQFIAEDVGEVLQLDGEYHSKCPDRAVEYVTRVVAVAAPPIVPALVVVYIDEECVTLQAPRPLRKDETLSWTAAACDGDGDHGPLRLYPTNMSDGSDGIIACGARPYTRCNVFWTATALAGVVTKTLSIRRCQKPPLIGFHKSGAEPAGSVVRITQPFLTLPLEEQPQSAALFGERGAPLVPRRIIPLAGSAAELGFSFNYSGRQDYFSVTVDLLENADQRAVCGRHIPTEEERNEVAGAGRSDSKAHLDLKAIEPLVLARVEMQPPAPSATRVELLEPHRRWAFTNLLGSTTYDLRYTIRHREKGDPVLVSWKEDADEFVRRGMCRERVLNVTVLSLTPASVALDGLAALWKAPAALRNSPVGIVPFCSAKYVFSLHPSLHQRYHYDFTWRCDKSEMAVVKRSPTRSDLEAVADSTKLEFVCYLKVSNTLTGTEQEDAFILRRMTPAPYSPSVVVLGDNVVPEPTGNAEKLSSPSAPLSAKAKLPVRQDGVGAVVGRSMILHVDSPAVGATSEWRVLSFTPSRDTSAAVKDPLESIVVVPQVRHELAVARAAQLRRGSTDTAVLSRDNDIGATVLISNIQRPGLYTIEQRQTDPVNPFVCDNVSVLHRVQVYHAAVIDKEVTVCSDVTALRAEPIPLRLTKGGVYGKWDVVSVESEPGQVATSGPSVTGIHLHSPRNARTIVGNLPFGIVVIRWGIYRDVPVDPQDPQSPKVDGPVATRLVLLDADTVTLYVLTEGLGSSRLVTLSHAVGIEATSSTVNWRLDKAQSWSLEMGPVDIHFDNATPLGAAAHDGLPFNLPFFSSAPWRQREPVGAEGVSSVNAGVAAVPIVQLKNLPLGPTRLIYDLQPSQHRFGKLLDRSCPTSSAQTFEVERVSAFLSSNTTLDHECDAYTGNGALRFCLLTKGVRYDPQSRKMTLEDLSRAKATGMSQPQVGLVDAEVFEERLKASAAAFSSESGCSVPWWATPLARWEQVSLSTDRMCISFVARAVRHLSPAELAQPLLTAKLLEHNRLQACPRGPDFITSEVIEGASLRGNVFYANPGGRPVDAGANATPSSSPPKPRCCAKGLLPVLDPKSLDRVDLWMRPLIGLRATADDVLTESSMSTEPRQNVVTLHLEEAGPGRMGGFVLGASADGRESLLTKCVNGNLVLGDVLRYWFEVNRPDGVTGATMREWSEYVHATQDQFVPCEALFQPLSHAVTRASEASWVEPAPSVEARAATADESPRTEGAGRSPAGRHATLVPLDVLEKQLASLERAYRWTRDGIDVTGLRPELQAALSRRRVTMQQLREIEVARQAQQKQRSTAASSKDGDPYTHALISGGSVASGDNATRMERFLAVHRVYRGITNMEIASIRLFLPPHASFAIPYNLFLRTGIDKNVVCGSSIPITMLAAPREAESPSRESAPPVLSPDPLYSLILLSRVEIVDEPPAITLHPPVVKQCEVESDFPLITVNVTGANFASHVIPIDRLRLDEVWNPNISASAYKDKRVGLQRCLAEMHRGAKIAVSPHSKKQLFIQLAPCPSFQMLAPEEYNEHQESETLLEKLKFPLLLRVTLLGGITADSFSSKSATVRHPSSGRSTVDISFIVEVRPTLARLHLRLGVASRGRPWTTDPRRPLLVCEADLKSHGFELGVELIGDTWNSRVGEFQESRSGDLTVPRVGPVDGASGHLLPGRLPHGSSAADSRPAGRSPHNTAIINSFSVVEHHAQESPHHQFLRSGGLYRSHFITYLHSSILSESSAEMSSMRLVDRYNDTFTTILIPPIHRNEEQLLWTSAHDPRGRLEHGGKVLDGDTSRDAALLESVDLPLLRPFSSVEEILFAVPGISTECQGCLLADTTFFVVGDYSGLWWFPPAAAPELDNSALASPVSLPFYSASSVPRVWAYDWLCPMSAASSMRRVLKAWQTLRDAGYVQPSAASLRQQQQPSGTVSSGRSSETSSDGEAHVPFLEMDVVAYSVRDIFGGDVAPDQRPLVLLTSEPLYVASLVDPLPGDPVEGRAEDELAESSAAWQRDHTINGASLLQHLKKRSALRVNESVAHRAYSLIAADYMRFGRPHLRTIFDYAHHEQYANGRLALNASVFFKLCVVVPLPDNSSSSGSGGTATSNASEHQDVPQELRYYTERTPSASRVGEAAAGSEIPVRREKRCSIVSITPALLVVEPPRQFYHSIYDYYFGRQKNSRHPAEGPQGGERWMLTAALMEVRRWLHYNLLLRTITWLHHAGTASLVYFILLHRGGPRAHAAGQSVANQWANPYTGFRGTSSGGTRRSATVSMSRLSRTRISTFIAEREATARIGVAVFTFVAVAFLYDLSESVWLVVWQSLWISALVYLSPHRAVTLYYVMSVLFWAFVM